MDKNNFEILIDGLYKSVYLEYDIDKSTSIYETISRNNLIDKVEKDIYKLVPIMSYFILIKNYPKLKSYIDYLENNMELYNKYEQYFFTIIKRFIYII